MPANFNISAALTAIWNNNVEGLQAALIPDKIYNRQNWTLLHFAAAAAASDVAVYLINAGADTTVKDTAEKTFLKIAGELCNQQFIEVCKETIAGQTTIN